MRDSFETQRPLREGFSWRIGERPILQEPAINILKMLKAFDLVASHHQIKNSPLCDLGVSAVKASELMLSLRLLHCFFNEFDKVSCL